MSWLSRTPPSPSPPVPEIGYRPRWMVRRDVPAVVAIEAGTFHQPWDAADFQGLLRRPTLTLLVAEAADDSIAAYMGHEQHHDRLHLVTLAVHPDHRRKGVGRMLVERGREGTPDQYRFVRGLPADLASVRPRGE